MGFTPVVAAKRPHKVDSTFCRKEPWFKSPVPLGHFRLHKSPSCRPNHGSSSLIGQQTPELVATNCWQILVHCGWAYCGARVSQCTKGTDSWGVIHQRGLYRNQRVPLNLLISSNFMARDFARLECEISGFKELQRMHVQSEKSDAARTARIIALKYTTLRIHSPLKTRPKSKDKNTDEGLWTLPCPWRVPFFFLGWISKKQNCMVPLISKTHLSSVFQAYWSQNASQKSLGAVVYFET